MSTTLTSPTPLRCPACHRGTLALSPNPEGAVQCDACAAAFGVHAGVLDLTPHFHPRRTLGQALMEWRPIVAIYESRLWRRSVGAALLLGIDFEREQRRVLAALALGTAMRVLDLASGSGIYARAIARRVPSGHVVALDLSPAMLAYAVRKARREHAANITWVHGDAMDLPLADASVDAVNCCGALHLFPDAARALAEIQRVLRAGGGFVAAVARRAEDGAAAGLAARLAARSGIASWTETEFRERLADAGFDRLVCHHAGGAWMIWSARKAPIDARHAEA